MTLPPVLTRSLQFPVWLASAALVVVGVGGFLAGHSTGDEGSPATTPEQAVVDSIDPSGGVVCLDPGERGGTAECYQAPGLGLSVGDSVRYVVEPQPVNPEDTGVGTRPTLVWIDNGQGL